MKTVLLVEDNKEFANSCIEKLLENGFHVEYADNAERAKQIFIEKKVDILVIDLMLPPTLSVEGVNFYRFTKEHKSVPAIFMTSKSFKTTEIVAEAMQLGAGDFLDKENEVFFDKLIFSVKNSMIHNTRNSTTSNKSTLFIISIYLLLFIFLTQLA
jgi:DNA-binding response OmpR family regulator